MSIVNIRKKELNKRGINNIEEWLKRPNSVYIGRKVMYMNGTYNSKWCNPFSVKKYGRKRCLELYEDYIKRNKELMKDLFEELHGKELGCWCHPEQCHGDILLKLMNTYNISP